MSLRRLPEIRCEAPPGVRFAPDDDAMVRWNPGVRAAAETDDNVISIYEVIGEDGFSGDGVTSRRIAAALRRMGPKPVQVNVNSPGGDFFEGIGIYNLLRQHPARVTVDVVGLAASAASVIAMAGDTVRISDVGFLMLHNAWALAIGNRHDLRQAANMLEPFDQAMAGLYAERSGAGEAEAVKWMDSETWFNARQAVDAGLADELLPRGAIGEAEPGAANAGLAVRRVDAALARQGLSRQERRSLLGEIKRGMHDAAASATQDAGDFGLGELLSTIRS